MESDEIYVSEPEGDLCSPPLTRTIPARRDYSRLAPRFDEPASATATSYSRILSPSGPKPKPLIDHRGTRGFPARYRSKSGQPASLLRDVATNILSRKGRESVGSTSQGSQTPTDCLTSVVTPASADSPEKLAVRFYGPAEGTKAASPSRHGRDFCRSKQVSTVRPSPVSSSSIVTPSHLVGFPNRGLTCYMNAVLQAVLGISTMFDSLLVAHAELEEKLRKLPAENNVFFSNSLLRPTCRLAFIKSRGRQGEVGKILDELKANLVKKHRQFKGLQMQDAHEFLVTLLDSIHMELLKISTLSGSTVISNLFKSAGESGETLITKNVQFEVRDTRTCRTCCLVASNKVKDYVFKLNPPTASGTAEERQSIVAIEELLTKTMNLRSKFRCENCVERRKGMGFNDCDEMVHEISERFVQLPKLLILYCPRIDCFRVSIREGNRTKLGYRKNRMPVLASEYISLSGLTEGNLEGRKRSPSTLGWGDELPAKSTKSLSNTNVALPVPEVIAGVVTACEDVDDGGFCDTTGSGEKPDVAALSDSSQTPEKLKNLSFEAIQNLSASDQLAFAIRESLRTHLAEGSFGSGATSRIGCESNVSHEARNDRIGASNSIVVRDKERVVDGEQNEVLAAEDRERPPQRRTSTSPRLPSPAAAGKENVAGGRVRPRSDVGALEYRLSAVVSHLGLASSTDNGHYVSDVYSFSKKSWFRYNDACVSKKTAEEVIQENARDGYIFFYVKTET